MGLFSKLFSPKKSEYTTQKAQDVPKSAPEVSEQSKEEVKAKDYSGPIVREPPKLDVVIPVRKDGASLAYNYSVPFLLTNRDAALLSASKKEWYLTPEEVDGEIHLFSSGVDIGKLLEREDMMRDWMKRNDPYIICIEKIKGDSDTCSAYIAFYKDKRKGNEWREQTVVALTAYKSEDTQFMIGLLEGGEELEAEEDFEEHVIITSDGGEIGRLPAKYAKRYMEDGAYAIFYEGSEQIEKNTADFDYVEKPFVRIYWYDRAD